MIFFKRDSTLFTNIINIRTKNFLKYFTSLQYKVVVQNEIFSMCISKKMMNALNHDKRCTYALNRNNNDFIKFHTTNFTNAIQTNMHNIKYYY